MMRWMGKIVISWLLRRVRRFGLLLGLTSLSADVGFDCLTLPFAEGGFLAVGGGLVFHELIDAGHIEMNIARLWAGFERLLKEGDGVRVFPGVLGVHAQFEQDGRRVFAAFQSAAQR